MKNSLCLIIIFHQLTINIHSTVIDLYVFRFFDTCHTLSVQIYISVLINGGSGLAKLMIGVFNNPIRIGYFPAILKGTDNNGK